MKRPGKLKTALAMLIVLAGFTAGAQTQKGRDERVDKFLKDHRRDWHDLNVPFEDGKTLHDLIVTKGYRSALEIGTSTGHSTVWLAWALSKTGGKLITIEIDEGRQQQAIANVREAGLSDYVDFRLADAHELVKKLEGPFDFVFSDADKDWYVQYFKDMDPKLRQGGCFTAHNVLNGMGSIRDFNEYVAGLKTYNTRIDKTSRAGISISEKK